MKTVLILLIAAAITAGGWRLLSGTETATSAADWAPVTMAERVSAAAEACVTAWGALPGYAPIAPQGGAPIDGPDEVYGCTGISERAGAMFAVVRYAGGDRTRPDSYRFDALCGAEGAMLLQAGGRTPEMCGESPL